MSLNMYFNKGTGIPLVVAANDTSGPLDLTVDGMLVKVIPAGAGWAGRIIHAQPGASISVKLGTVTLTKAVPKVSGVASLATGEAVKALHSYILEPRKLSSGVERFTLAGGGVGERYPFKVPGREITCQLVVGHEVRGVVDSIFEGGKICLRSPSAAGLDPVRVLSVKECMVHRYVNALVYDFTGVELWREGQSLIPELCNVPAVTVGEACRANAKCGESLESIIKRVNGVS